MPLLLSFLMEQLHNGGVFSGVERVKRGCDISCRWCLGDISLEHGLSLQECRLLWCGVEKRRKVLFRVEWIGVRPDDRRRWLLMPFIPELRPFAYRQVQDLWLWITARGRVPPHVDVISVLLFGCLDAFVIFVTQRLLNV